MSTLKYGVVDMKVVKTNDIIRASHRTEDGADHILTDWIIDVECWWNPSATSYFGDVANVNESPFATGGSLPAITDKAIREYLFQSRRRIDYRDDLGNPILFCPVQGSTRDAANGPFVERCDVNAIHGEKSWHISIRLRASIVECPGGSEEPSPLLANRWHQWMDIDEDHFSTINTEGVAVFRGETLDALGGIWPDQYRRDLMFTVPENYKRENVHVEQIMDGNTIRYRIVDREKPLNINKSFFKDGVTRIEAYQTGGYTEPSLLSVVGDAAGNMIQAAPGLAFGIVPGVVGMGAGAATAVIRGVPQYANQVVCSIWGNRKATRMKLTMMALGIVTTRLGSFSRVGRSTDFSLTHDLMGKFVRLEMKTRWGISQAISDVTENVAIPIIEGALTGMESVALAVFGAIAPAGADDPAEAAAVVANDVINHVGPAALFSTCNFPPIWDNTGVFIGSGDAGHLELDGTESLDSSDHLHTNPPPPNSGGTRGTSLINIVTQLLNDPCGLPVKPPILEENIDMSVY